jgi:hypothetical protein
MTSLPMEDDGLGGILAYYSTHHTAPTLLPVVFGDVWWRSPGEGLRELSIPFLPTSPTGHEVRIDLWW